VDQATLYQRIGGRDAITAVVERAVAKHFTNATIKARFEAATQPQEALVRHAVELFCTGLSGEVTYEGRSMPDTHAGMDIDEVEFIAAIDDIVEAMDEVGVGPAEQHEVVGILYGMKADVLHR
jgi:hemoglobin